MEKSWVKTFERQEQDSQELSLCHCGYSICEAGHSFGPPSVRITFCTMCWTDGAHTASAREPIIWKESRVF